MSETKKSLLKKPFSWGFVVCFAAVIGIVVGVLNCIPFLYDTSFTDPALTFDVWIPLAIFIILGSKNTLDAALKCFVFFLVSQPVIYLVKIAANVLAGGAIAEAFHQYFIVYYIGAGWLTWTILTLPGGAIAYQVKRDNVPAAVILAVATGALVGLGLDKAFRVLPANFPHHLLSVIFCIGMAFLLCFLVFKKKKTRAVTLCITAVTTIALTITLAILSGKPASSIQTFDLGDKKTAVDCEVKNDKVATAKLIESNVLEIQTAEEIGDTVVKVTFKDGTTAEYRISVDSRNMTVEEPAS